MKGGQCWYLNSPKQKGPSPKGAWPYLNSSAPHIHMQPWQWVVLGNKAKPMLHRVYTGHERYYRSHYNQWCCLHWMLRGATNLRKKTAAKFYLFELFEVTCGEVMNLCSAFNPFKCTHTQQWTHTHTVNTHPEPMLRRGSNWGFGQGSRLSHGTEGGENTCYSLPPTDNSCRPEIRTHNRGLQVRCSIHSATTAFMTCWHKFQMIFNGLFIVSSVDTVLLTYREEPKRSLAFCSLSPLQRWKADPIFTRVLLLALSFHRRFPLVF